MKLLLIWCFGKCNFDNAQLFRKIFIDLFLIILETVLLLACVACQYYDDEYYDDTEEEDEIPGLCEGESFDPSDECYGVVRPCWPTCELTEMPGQ